jgi:hypothetical protein
VRVVEQTEECGHGEPFHPIDVDLVFGEQTVSLRGPWNETDLVKIAPTAADLQGRYEYHLDYPGHTLDPKCDYEHWARRLTEGSSPAAYAHVATDPRHPGKLALQYWFFYPYNQWNNLHEGDWEMIQLVFDAGDAKKALGREPAEIGYSQHEGAERAGWDDDKLERVGEHPVVYPGAGSHANYFDQALHVGSSGEQGVGCDDTQGPHTQLNPRVLTIPSDPAAAQKAFPWLAYEGRWGELQQSFYNGPTGPSLKTQWTQPIAWVEDKWRSQSYSVPTGGLVGTSATDFFCSAVAKGSVALTQLLRSPQAMLITLALFLALVLFIVWRATWTPVAPLRLARRRTWGQILSASARMYVRRPIVFLGIGFLLIPLAFVLTILQKLVLDGFGLIGVDSDSESAGALVILAFAIGLAFTVLGLALVQAATACALVRIDEERPVNPVVAFRDALSHLRPLVGSAAIVALMLAVLSSTAVLLPVGVWLAVRWALVGQVVVLEDRKAVEAVHRSAVLVRRKWFLVASIVGVGAAVVIVGGPFVGAVLILLTDIPFTLLNVLAGVVYALTMPFVALATSYVYFDLRTRHELGETRDPEVLPAEIQLTTG